MNGFVGVLIGAGLIAAATTRRGREFVSQAVSIVEANARERFAPRRGAGPTDGMGNRGDRKNDPE